jgi:hypothetical protein
MELTWNPFAPRPEATKLATKAYWEARQRNGVYTNNTQSQIEESEGQPRPVYRQKAPRKGYELEAFEVGATRQYPTAVLSEPTLRKRRAQNIRASIAILHQSTTMRFQTRALEAGLEVRRIA